MKISEQLLQIKTPQKEPKYVGETIAGTKIVIDNKKRTKKKNHRGDFMIEIKFKLSTDKKIKSIVEAIEEGSKSTKEVEEMIDNIKLKLSISNTRAIELGIDSKKSLDLVLRAKSTHLGKDWEVTNVLQIRNTTKINLK